MRRLAMACFPCEEHDFLRIARIHCESDSHKGASPCAAAEPVFFFIC